jgi:NAD-dependent DNA ligase
MAHFKCIENLRNCSISDLNQIDGFDQITSTNVYSGLDKFFAFYDSIKSEIIFLDKIVESSNLTGISVCMTGFRDAGLQEKIEANGGKVVSGVSKKTTHLLAADKNSNSTKLKKARDLGITIMEPEEFKNYFSLF